MLNPGQPVTVVIPGLPGVWAEELCHATVALTYDREILVNIGARDNFPLTNLHYAHSEENRTWARGHIPLDGDEAKALLLAYELSK